MTKIMKYLKPYKWGVALVFLLVAVRAALELLLPKLMSLLLGELNVGDVTLDPNMQKMWMFAGLMLFTIFVTITVAIISGYFEAKITSAFAVDLRLAVYNKIETFSLTEMDHFTTSSLITRSTNDIQQLQGYVGMLMRMIIMQPILAVGAITMAFLEHPRIALILLGSISIILILIIFIYSISLPKFKIMQRLVDKLNLVTRENLTGLRVVRAHNTQTLQEDKIEKASLETKNLNIFLSRINQLLWPVMGLVMGITSLLIIGMSATKYIDYTNKTGVTPEQMMALMQYGMRSIMAFMFLTMIFIMIPRARVSAIRIMEVLDMEPKIKDADNLILLDFSKAIGKVEYRNVSFYYQGASQPVLNNINFIAKAGETTAFIGSTGSGKSTLINLLPRLYDATTGEILVDGINIKDISQKELHRLIGYVPQQGILFSGTIKDNIAFGAGNEIASIENSAKIAQASNFIESFDDKYDSSITQGGTNVSGGQRQRLSIARAINKHPKILIFDDSFSALDYKTDSKLREALIDVPATKLIVGQRINTIRNAEQIIVLNNGEIVCTGTHRDLMKTCEVYKEIAYSQLSEEELT